MLIEKEEIEEREREREKNVEERDRHIDKWMKERERERHTDRLKKSKWLLLREKMVGSGLKMLIH